MIDRLKESTQPSPDPSLQLSQAETDEIVGAMVRAGLAGKSPREIRMISYEMFVAKFAARMLAKLIADNP